MFVSPFVSLCVPIIFSLGFFLFTPKLGVQVVVSTKVSVATEVIVAYRPLVLAPAAHLANEANENIYMD